MTTPQLHHAGPSKAVGWRELLCWALLLSWLVLSRLVVAPLVLYDWDAANYALALRSFDIFEHQPHPPGNPIFIVLLALCQWAPGPVGPFLVVNALLGVLILLLLGWVLRPVVGPRVTWVMALAFSFCQPFWYQGAVSTAYVAECFVSVSVGALSLAVLRGSLQPAWAGALVGLVLGLRPSALPAMLPLFVWALLWARTPPRDAVRAGLALGLGCLLWAVPLITLGGGWQRYRIASAALTTWQIQLGSILGDGRLVPKNSQTLVLYLTDAMNLLLIGVTLNGLVLALRRQFPWRGLAFLGVWFVPGALVYALHHLPKSGYVLTLVPPMFIGATLLAWAAADGLQGWVRRAVVGLNITVTALYVGINGLAFWYAVPAKLAERHDAPIALPSPVVLTGDYGRIGLAYRTWPHRQLRALFSTITPSDDLVLFLYGTYELMRLQMADFPQARVLTVSLDHHTWFKQPRGAGSSFGDFQLQVMPRPPQGLSHRHGPTQISVEGGRLHLSRQGRALDLELGPVPGVLWVFAPCPPCNLEIGAGLSKVQRRRIDHQHVAIALRRAR